MPARLIGPITLALLVAVTSCFFLACSEDDKADLDGAEKLATQFHDSMMTRDIEAVVRCVSYPFIFDKRATAKNEAEFRKLLAERWNEMLKKMRSAVLTEEIGYQAFIDGAEFRGSSFKDPEEAKRQAAKIDFKEDCILVCCYHIDRETNRTDARAYYLVISPNELGDLKVVSYYD